MAKNICNYSKVKDNNDKKFSFKKKKESAIQSLTDVEIFLRNFKKFTNYIKLYKLMK